MRSEKYSLVKEDLKRVGVGALVAILGALATYFEQTIPNIDFNAYTPLVVAINSVVVNVIRKYVAETIYK